MKLKKNLRTSKVKNSYHSTLRKEQAQLTIEKIQNALFNLFQEKGNAEKLTYKSIAKKAGVTEMTVYRYFPERSTLMKSLWERINQNLGANIGMPKSSTELLAQNKALHGGFSRNKMIASASISSAQGREMRTALNSERQAAFLKIVQDLNPNLSLENARSKAAILQLLHSAYAWDSIQLHWDLTGEEIGNATQEALEVFIQHIKKERNK